MIRLLTTLLLSAALALPVNAEKKHISDEELFEHLDLLMRVFQHIRTDYVEEVDEVEVLDAAIQGMLRSLDPHSSYINRELFQEINIQVEGQYGGLGMEVQTENGVLKVVTPIDGTPAERAGLKGGDYITHVDGEEIVGLTTTQAVKYTRGPAGTEVTITVVREGNAEPFDLTLVRENIKIRPVRHRVEADTIGYIRISAFNMHTGNGVREAVAALKAELGAHMEGIVLDMRNNPGGILDEAVDVADTFLEQGEIVSIRGRTPYSNDRDFATPGDDADGLPIIILMNAFSASAAEVVAGALSDHRRAIIVGDTSFGKGTVQSEIRLGRKGDHAIRLTTSRYYTPSGISIQEYGIEPDIEVLFPGQRTGRARLRREASLRGAIKNETSGPDKAGETDDTVPEPADVKLDEDGRPLEDIQLQYAIKLLKGMTTPPATQSAHRGEEGYAHLSSNQT